MKVAYKDFSFRSDTLNMIAFMDRLIDAYQAQGFKLSVRQLYYQLVARNQVENTEASYKRVASIINDARLAGLIDWDAIEDRGRDVELRTRWESGSQIIDAAAGSFHMDMWDNQHQRVFVVVEKAALAGVLGPTCRKYDVPLLAARGYPSVSILREMTEEHFLPAMSQGQGIVVLHLGDHDPSGIDMTRDLEERFTMFIGDELDGDNFVLHRIALSMEQINRHKPPPNPAKTTDARFAGYRKTYGTKSWELDALEPAVLVRLITDHISSHMDDDDWNEREEEVEDIRKRLNKTAIEWRANE